MLRDSRDPPDPSHPDERAPLLDVDAVVDSTPVYPVLHLIRTDIIVFIDAPLTYEALTGPDLTYSLVRPLVDKYHAIQLKGNKAVVFCLLLNRAHFLRDSSASTIAVSRTRATLCEIIAIALLAEWADILDLAAVTTIAWPVFNGADSEVLSKADQYADDLLQERVGNAIEMAIIGKAKRFIKSRPCQTVIDHIWSGKCVYTAESHYSLISDTYKRNPIRMYDPHKAPVLDHYRLKVPAVRSVLEYCTFLILFILFVIALEYNDVDYLTSAEIVFMVYGFGFSLEKLATMQEHGLRVYVTGTWNGFDLAFVTIYAAYISLRLHGVYNHHAWAREAGLDILALAAVLIFPRLAFVTLSNNLLVLSLRSMFMEFMALMTIAAFIFAGFLYALWTLSRGSRRDSYQPGQIAWWMLDLWFGLDATAFQLSSDFHPFFGPVLFIVYAALSNTLLLTVLVSILSHTFTTISADAEAEAMFRRAVSTIEGVKADALLSYLPPVNIIALVLFLPLSYLLTPRWFHKVNVAFIRISNLPILLFISFYERQATDMSAVTFYETVTTAAERLYDSLPRRLKRITLFEGLVSGGPDIDAVFEIEEELEAEADIRTSRYFSSTQVHVDQRDEETATSKLQPPFLSDSSAETTASSTPAPNASLAPPSTAAPVATLAPPSAPSTLTINGPDALPAVVHAADTVSPFPRSPSPNIFTQPSGSPASSPGRDHLHLNALSSGELRTPPRPRRRSRLHSQMSRADVIVGPPIPHSPLTHVYQPLIVDLDEDIPEDGTLPPGPLSSGRRRLSMHRRNVTEPMNSLPIPALQRRATAAARQGQGPELGTSAPFSESPQAETRVRADSYDHDHSDLVSRLGAIEERQARIEDLLHRLVNMHGR